MIAFQPSPPMLTRDASSPRALILFNPQESL
jgi:hypothetical protein